MLHLLTLLLSLSKGQGGARNNSHFSFDDKLTQLPHDCRMLWARLVCTVFQLLHCCISCFPCLEAGGIFLCSEAQLPQGSLLGPSSPSALPGQCLPSLNLHLPCLVVYQFTLYQLPVITFSLSLLGFTIF